MAPTEFHKFGELPPELRLDIWELAMRDCRPGVHIFNVNKVPPEHQQESFPSEPGEVTLLGIEKKGCSTFGHSETVKVGDSVVVRNCSTYLIDSGMWTACQESKRVMEARVESVHRYYQCCMYRHEKGAISFQRETPPQFPGRTASFINKDGEQQFFHIYSRDLIILKPLHRFQVWPNMSHIALEFFPGWAHDSYHRYLRNLAGFAANLDFLWFIDHTLTRAPGFEGALPNHTYVFYGKGFRMVEVRRGDDGWVHSDMSPPGSNGPGCFSAIDIMRQEQDRMNAETFEQYSEDPEDVSPYVGARLGVLAVEIVSRDFYE